MIQRENIHNPPKKMGKGGKTVHFAERANQKKGRHTIFHQKGGNTVNGKFFAGRHF